MKQAEKSAQSRAAILNAAIGQFAESGYDGITLNRICQANGISKGQFYHYFASKEELYCACALQCFRTLADYLESHVRLSADVGACVCSYMDARTAFFKANKSCGQFVIAALLSVSRESNRLAGDGIALLDRFNKRFFGGVLDRCVLREGISRERAMTYLEMAQQMYHAYLNARSFEADDERAIDGYHVQIKELLLIILNGIVK